jgi:signal transduction histidine kinase
LLVAALFSIASLAQAQPAPKRVLVLYGYDPNAPGVIAFTNALRATIQSESSPRVIFYDELLDLGRFPENARREALVRYIVGKYRGFHFDAILAVGTVALKFAIERMTTDFPRAPVVYGLAFEALVDFSALPKNVTGVHHLMPFVATLRLARALQPDAERVVLIGGTTPGDSVLLANGVRDLTPLVGGMELVVWRDWTYQSLPQRMRTLPPHTITILSGFSRDTNGQHFNSGDLISSVTRWASGPVYGIVRNWVGDGIIGGAVMDFGDDGVRTGQLLLRVLDRASGELALPPQVAVGPEQVLDWRALERWGIAERRIPADTKILFRTPTLWQRFRILLLAAAALIAAQSALIALLLMERRKRRRALRLVDESRDQLAHIGRVATLGELTAAISHELRQPLAAIRANAEAGRMLLDRTPSDLSEAREAFTEIASDDMRAVEVLDRIRSLVRKDDPVAVSVDLNQVCERSAEVLMYDALQRGVQLSLSLESNLPPVIGDSVQLQQVVVNLVLNAMEAAQASPRIRDVELGTSAATSGEEVEIFVRDTGPGLSSEAQVRAFEPFYSTKKQGLGMGLAIVQSIVEQHRGSVRTEKASEGGAIFRVRLPIEARDAPRGNR